jgi:glycosyltransferase involved in cell wall biosynthesis
VRVLFVCSADFSAPSEKHALGWAEGLAARGHETMVAVRGERTSPNGQEGAPAVKAVAYRFRGPHPDSAFLRTVKEFGPAIVHAFNPRLAVITAVQAVSKVVPSCRVCVHFEDDEWGLASGGGLHPWALRRTLRAGGRLAAAAKPDLWPFATRRSLRWATCAAHGLDALTPMLSAHVAERSSRDCQTLLPVLPDLPPPKPDACPIQLTGVGSQVMLFTGAVYGAHLPDFMILLKAVATLRQRGMDVGLVHTGHLARRLTPAAMLKAASLDPTAARFMGYVPSSSMPELLHRADALVQPGAPTAFNRLRLPSKLQAYLASGTPTVTFATGFGAMLRDRIEVLKTHGPSPEELADRIAEVLADRGLASILSAGGPEAARRLFNRDRNTEALIAHYEQVLATSR